MSIYQELGVINKKAHGLAIDFLRLVRRSIIWSVALIITIFLSIRKGIGITAKVLFQNRNSILGLILFVAALVTFLLSLNILIGRNDQMGALRDWLTSDSHWIIVLFAVFSVLLISWNHISPTLRTTFNRGWWRVVAWGTIGLLLVLSHLMGALHEDISYRDMYVGSLICLVVILAIIAKVFHPKKIDLSESFYIEDNPKAHDDVEPYESQSRIIADIRSLITTGRPSTVAISGQWGVGKSFLLHRATAPLKRDKKIIWVEFEPWRYASEEALIRGFYQDVGSMLAKGIPGIQHITKPLAETTDQFIRQKDETGFISMFADGLKAITTSVEGPESQINDLLNREGKRLVIVIDDVERSFDPERIFRTLQIANFAKTIENLQVIFLCEKDVILNARPAHFGGIRDITDYLEKFIEREVNVPTPRPQELRQHFGQLVDRHPIIQSNFDTTDLSDELLSALGTPRSVLRLFNEYAAFYANQERNEG